MSSVNIQEISSYVKRTGMKDPKERFGISVSDLNALHQLLQNDPFRALSLTFDYGKAKGYRMARTRKGAVA